MEVDVDRRPAVVSKRQTLTRVDRPSKRRRGRRLRPLTHFIASLASWDTLNNVSRALASTPC